MAEHRTDYRKDHQWHFVRTRNTAKKDRFQKYTLLVQRTINFDSTLGDTVVEIRSPSLVDLLHSTLKDSRCLGLYKVPLSVSLY
jgi:hypothetical protein